MFEIQGPEKEKIEIAKLLDILQKTKTGSKIVARVHNLLGQNRFVLKFDRTMLHRGECEFKQIRLNPKRLSSQNEQVATLGHELVHAMMWDIENAALRNVSSLDEYALIRLLSEAQGHMMGDLIFQELSPQQQNKEKNPHALWWENINLITKKDRTLYLEKALTCQTGWAEYEMLKLKRSMKFTRTPNRDVFVMSCSEFLKEMDTDVSLSETLKMKPYSYFVQHCFLGKLKKLFGR